MKTKDGKVKDWNAYAKRHNRNLKIKRMVRQFPRKVSDQTQMLWNRLVAKVTGEDLFWEYESPVTGVMSDGQYATADEAALAASKEWDEYHDEWEDDGESFPPSDTEWFFVYQVFASDTTRITRKEITSTTYEAGDDYSSERLTKTELGL